MKSLKDLLILGPGPSSSHTIGPYRISLRFISEIAKEKVSRIEVTLYGSLALTGKGHSTDRIICNAFKDYPCQVFFDNTLDGLSHPNTMECKAYLSDGRVIDKRYHSIGEVPMRKKAIPASERMSILSIRLMDSRNI